jgi:hypothetical protein
MTARVELLAVLLAFACFGSPGQAQTSAGSAVGNAPPDAPANTVKGTITDPTMHGMKAIEVTYPAKWRFKGGMYLSGVGGYGDFLMQDCGSTPTGVYRATSPDGLSFVEQLPAPAWGWASGFHGDWYRAENCFPLHGPTTAREFLKYLAATLGVEYVSDEPAPAAENAKLQEMVRKVNAVSAQLKEKDGEKLASTQWSAELARAAVRYKNGTFTMKGRLNAQVYCWEVIYPADKAAATAKAQETPTTVDRCAASVVYLVAPENQYAGLIEQWDRPGMGARALDSWAQARAARTISDKNGGTAFNFIRDEERLSWRYELARTKEVWRKMFAQFNDTVQLGTEKALTRSAELANSQHAIAADWVDDLLDEKTATDPENGGIPKESSTRATWIDSNGKSYFQARDASANPNGVLEGTWTQRQAAHGDGTQ